MKVFIGRLCYAQRPLTEPEPGCLAWLTELRAAGKQMRVVLFNIHSTYLSSKPTSKPCAHGTINGLGTRWARSNLKNST
jgi:hypothetical protein